MAFDILCALYESEFLQGQFLGLFNAESVDLEEIQFGGIGSGKYVINSDYEDATVDLVTPNRIDCYFRRSTLSQEATPGFVNLQVITGSNFLVGQGAAIYDGLNYDFGYITAISGNQITLDRAITHTYFTGATAFVLQHRGRISSVDLDPNLQNIQTITTQSYFQELAQKVLDASSIANKECGWVIYNLINLYAPQVDIFISAANFTMTTDAQGNLNGTGTNMPYYSTFANRPLIQVLQDVVNCSNGNPNAIGNGNPLGATFMLWVDAPNAIHFAPVNQSTPSKTFAINTNSATDDGLYDNVTAHTTHAQDLTAICNTYKIAGAVDPSTQQPVTVTVFDQNSVNQYGQIEQSISNPNIFDQTTLKNYGVALLNATAYPVENYKTTISPIKNFVTCRDYVQLTGFTDSSTIEYNPLSIHTLWDATKPGQFSQEITGAQLLPNITKTMKQISNEHYIAAIGVTAGGTNIQDRFVINGLVGSYSYATFGMSAGIFQAYCEVNNAPLLTEFDIPAYTTTIPADGVYTVSYLYRNTDGSEITVPAMVIYPGISADTSGVNPFNDYQICPFYQITRFGGVITNAVDIRNIGGINGGNINDGQVGQGKFTPNPNLKTPPILASGTAVSGPVYPTQPGSGPYDAALTFTLTTSGLPDWLSAIRAYAVDASLDSGPTTGTMSASSTVIYNKNRVNKGDHSPTADAAYSLVWGSLSSGTAYKLYVVELDAQSFESPPLYLATTDPNPLILNGGNFLGMPDPANTTPSLDPKQPQEPLVYPSVGFATFDAETVVALSSLGTLTNPWLAEIQLVTQPLNSGDTTNWTLNDTEYPNTSGIYQLTWAAMGAGGQFNVGLRYKDHKKQTSLTLVIGTTVSNPVQGKAIDANTITKDHLVGMYDSDGKLLYTDFPGQVTSSYDANGNLILTNASGQIAEQTNSPNVRATVVPGTLNGVSFLESQVVGAVQISSSQVDDTKVLFKRYSTSVLNDETLNLTWFQDGIGAILSGDTISGGTLSYVNTFTDPSSGSPPTDTFHLPSGASVQILFSHTQPYKSGSNGIPHVVFKGETVTPGVNTLDNPTVAYLGTPFITWTGTIVTTPEEFFRDIGAFSSTATITQIQNTGTAQNQYNSGYLNPQAQIGTSTATIVRDDTPERLGAPDFSAWNDSWVGLSPALLYAAVQAPGPYQRIPTGAVSWAKFDNASNLKGSWLFSQNTDGSITALMFDWNVYGGVFSVHTWMTIGSAGQADAGLPSAGSFGNFDWFEGSLPGSLPQPFATGPSVNIQHDLVTINYPGHGPISVLRYFLEPTVSIGTGLSLSSISGFVNGRTANTSIGGDTIWNNSTLTTVGANFTTTPGPIIPFFSTGANTLAPTSSATQLNFHVNNTNYYSDAYGACEVVVFLYAPDGSLIEFWVAPAAGSDLTFSGSGAAAGSYTWAYNTEISTVNHNGSSSYGSNIDGYATWYQTDQFAIYNYYDSAADQGQFFFTSPSGTIAPADASVPLVVFCEQINAFSDSFGTSGLLVTITDPQNNPVVDSHLISTPNFDYGFVIPAAIQGQYSFQLFSTILTDAHTQGGSTPEGGGLYPVTAQGQVLWFDAVVVSSDIQFFDHSGEQETFRTATGTIAPTTSATQLSLNLTSVICPADANGFTEINLVLINPIGTTVLISSPITGPVSFSFWVPGALAGVYTWVLQAVCFNNKNDKSTYAVSASGTQGYYIIGGTGGGTFVLASDGSSHRLETNDANIQFTEFTPTTMEFVVTNDSSDSSTRQFDIALDISGI